MALHPMFILLSCSSTLFLSYKGRVLGNGFLARKLDPEVNLDMQISSKSQSMKDLCTSTEWLFASALEICKFPYLIKQGLFNFLNIKHYTLYYSIFLNYSICLVRGCF